MLSVCVCGKPQRAAINMHHNGNTFLWVWQIFTNTSHPFATTLQAAAAATLQQLVALESRVEQHICISCSHMLHGKWSCCAFQFSLKSKFITWRFYDNPCQVAPHLPSIAPTWGESRINRSSNRATNMIVGELRGWQRIRLSGADVLGLHSLRGDSYKTLLSLYPLSLSRAVSIAAADSFCFLPLSLSFYSHSPYTSLSLSASVNLFPADISSCKSP